jgi:amino acid adenylation domain-containing protein
MHILEALSYCRARSVELKLDGDRLKLVGNKAAIDDKLLSLVKEHKAGLIELLRAGRDEIANAQVQTVEPDQRGQLQLPSFNQQRLWFMQQLAVREGGNDGAYNGGIALVLRGHLDRAALGSALDALAQRHESLRTSFVDVDGQPWQQVRTGVRLECADVECGANDDIEALMRAAVAVPFDLANDALIRATLYAVAPAHHVLLLVTHHITSDARSQEILFADFCNIYDACVTGQASTLETPPYQYLDYARWERARMQGPFLANKLSQWRDYLQGAPRLHALPCDGDRLAVPRAGVERLEYSLDGTLAGALTALAKAEHSTLFGVMAAFYSILLHKLGNEPDVVFGMPAANRSRTEFETVTGYFSNTVVLRNQLPQDYTIRQAIATTKANLGFVLTHQDVPFDMLVDELKVERNLAFSPLYQLWFSMHEGRTNAFALRDLAAEVRPIERTQGRYDLKLEVEHQDGQLRLTWEYDRALFEPATIARFAQHFDRLMQTSCGAPDLPLSQVTFDTAPVVAAEAGAATLLPAAWRQSVARRPDSLAIGTMTFARADERADRLAALLAELGVGPGTCVGICAGCGAEALVATLATWKLGALCVPFVPGPAPGHHASLQAGTDLHLLLASAGCADGLELHNLELVLLQGIEHDDWLEDYAGTAAGVPPAADAVAAMLPAPGADGLLVTFTHGQLAHYAGALGQRHALAPGLVYGYAPVAGTGFFNTMLLLALAGEGSLQSLAHAAVDVMEATPAKCDALRAGRAAAAPRAVLFLTGHDPHAPLPALGNCRVVALHGPLESGIACLAHDGPAPGLGQAIGGARLLVLQGNAPAPAGAWGELVVAGPGIANGYAGMPSAHGRFAALDGFSAPVRAVRTGMRVRIDNHDRLVFGGRTDQRLMWRGFDVDPRRTESALRALPDVAAAAVVFDPAAGADGALAAYVVASATSEPLMRQLRQRLPHYLLPKAVIVLDALPILADGTLNLAALPAPESEQPDAATAHSASETALQAIWSELLARPHVARTDNFFDIGGHSLLATRMLNRVRSRIWSGLSLGTIFAHPVLADLARCIDQARAEAATATATATATLPAIEARTAAAGARLSCGQQQMWLIDRIEQGSSHYNMVAAYRLRGSLDHAALLGCLDQLVHRHAALRTRFTDTGGQVRQYAESAWTLAPRVDDLRAMDSAGRAARVQQHMREEAAHRFDLTAGRLLRATLLLLDEDEALLVLNIHHIACDGWSIGVLMRELRQLYTARKAGADAALPPLPIAYSDYAEWQRALIDNGQMAHAAAFWRDFLADAPPVHGLIPDKVRPAVADHAGAEIITRLSAAQRDGLRRLAREAGTTLFIGLESLFALFIARLSAGSDVVIGTPVSGRVHGDTEPVVGLFANMIALRHRIDFSQPALAYLAQSHALVSRAFGQQHYPFELLVEMLNPERSLAHHPLFQIVFGLKEAESKRMELADVEVTRAERDHVESKFDLMLSAVESDEGIRLEWQYASALFEAATIAAMADQFTAMLDALLAEPTRAIGELNLLAAADHAFFEAYANGPDAGRCDESLYACFAREAARNPEGIALASSAQRISYTELDKAAGDIAARLAGQGVTSSDRVAVYLPRGTDLIACLLGIVRLGAAYVPLDANYPVQRIAQILGASSARLLVADGNLLARLEDSPSAAITLDALRAGTPAAFAPPPADPEQLAYLMYTSGSTGAPKGVAIPVRAILRLVRQANFMPLDADTVMLQLATVGFDASTLEIWGPLLNGGTLAIYPDGVLDLVELTGFIERERVNAMWLTTALFEQWVEQLDRPLPQLRHVLTGGEVVSPAIVRRLYEKLEQVAIINGYGPTENTTFTSCYPIGRDWPVERPVPIGRPVAGTDVLVLDSRGQSLPVGAIGELSAAGAGVALGYWNDPALTAEKFVRDARSGRLLYRTGDLVRWQRDGVLQYLGRADQQVKIRGYRIELGEIERCLLAFEGVREVCVVIREERQLVAYFSGGADAPALRAHAQEQLPRFMVPVAFVALDAMPVTANGKVDKRALPAPVASDYIAQAYVAPEGALEQALAAVWCKVLKREQIGAEDNFFDLGGNSLLAIRMSSALQAATGHRLPIRQLFQLGTVRALAQWLGAQQAGAGLAPIARADRDGILVASYAQQRLWFIDRIDGRSNQYNMPACFDLEGELDVSALQSAVDALVQRHEVLRTSYREVDGAATQVIAPSVDSAIDYHDLRALPATQRDAAAAERLLAQARADFDLASGPVFRITLVRMDACAYRMLFNMHHIASDGWSVGVLIRDLAALYRAAAGADGAALAPLPVQYGDYAQWQRAQLSPERYAALAGYWRNQLNESPQLHALPLDFPRPARMSTRGAVIRTRAEPALTRALHALARRHEMSLFMLLQASYALLLARVSGEAEVVVGTPVAGRDRPELEALVGCFVNTVVLRNRIAHEATVEQYLGASRAMVLDAFEHQELPFDLLVEELNPVRSASHLPLFQVWFVLQNMEVGKLDLPGLAISEVARDEVAAKFDLMLTATERDGAIDFNWVYNRDLFDAATIDAWSDSFGVLLHALVGGTDRAVAELNLVGHEQRARLAAHACPARLPAPRHTMLRQFRDAALRHPGRLAVRSGDDVLSYSQLASRAERLASYLAEQGIAPGDRVGICCPRSAEQLVAVLGIWQVGAAYVPIDPQAPLARQSFIVADTGATMVLGTRKTLEHFDLPAIDLLFLDGAADDDQWLAGYGDQPDLSRIDALAYVLYTSGTSGRPKGVMVQHDSLSHLGQALSQMLRENGMPEALRWAWNAPLMFDASLQAVAQLGVGGELYILSEQLRTSPALLLDYMQLHAIEMLDGTPSLLELVLQEAGQRPGALPHMLIGGEPINGALWDTIAAAMARSGRVAINVYGPTETTVDATWARIESGTLPHIGRPLANVQVKVLDAQLQEVPPGAIGEGCIGGPGVARGYLNRPELDAEKFITLPVAGGSERFYRSGDMLRWRPDGTLAYLYRRDAQVKLRGYRIELGEIEEVLAMHPGVAEAAVVLAPDGGALLAYVVAHDESPGADALAAHCRTSLPEYMLPAAFIELAALPLTVSGKLDVRALPPPQDGQEVQGRRAQSATERALEGIWSTILGKSDLSVHANFFALGGHSLLAIRVISAIREQLGAELALSTFFAGPTIAQLAQVLEDMPRQRALPSIVPLAAGEALPLSFAQHRLWLIDRLEGASIQYNMPAAFELAGRFDLDACRLSLTAIVERHAVLRTTYAERDGHAVQCVQPASEVPVALTDLRYLAPAAQAAEVERRLRADATAPFDLAADLMLRAHVLRLAPERHVLMFNMHHIASDGWSINLLTTEFVQAYRAFAEGGTPEFAPLPIQYADFAHWQRNTLADEVLAAETTYWRRQLQGVPQVHSLPLDKPRPIRQTYNGALLTRQVPPALLASLKEFSRERDATLFMTLQTVLAALLARWSNEHDIVIGTPAAGRSQQSLEGLIGCFLNTLVLRSDLTGNPSFDDMLARTRGTVLEAFEHQTVPFEMLVDALKPERSLSHPALFQIMFVLQSQEQTAFALPSLAMRPVERNVVMAKFDLLLNANERAGALELTWTYNSDLFDAATIMRMADAYEQILHAVVACGATRLHALNLLPPAEADKMLRLWNDTAMALPYEQCLHELFVAQTRATPDAIAVIDEHGSQTYGELFAHAAALAERLRPHAAEPERLMAILLPKGRLQLAAALAIMMAGAAYLPLDTSWPAARIDQVMEHGDARVLLTSASLSEGITHCAVRIDPVEQALLTPADAAAALAGFASVREPDSLAYVIFTSGSTGKPKGVAIEHRSAVNTCLDINQRYGVGPDDAVLAVSALSFDLSVYDMFGLLAAGGRVVFPDEARQKDPAHWAELVERERISLWDSVPASAELLTAQYEWRARRSGGALRVLMMSGDWIAPTLPARIAAVFPGVAMHSLGGATEGSVWSISYPIESDMSERKSVPYGKPLANQAFYVLSDDLAPCPVGVVGELHIGGIGVARCYYGDRERTAASFIMHEALDDRLYKTGDLGRYLPDGNIEFIGRKDLQVKLRGFRIELGDIEAALTRAAGVADAVVMVLKDATGIQQLVAYVQLDADAQVDADALGARLRLHLGSLLPNYMVPAYYVVLDAFPLSPNNKVDRKQLPPPVWNRDDDIVIAPEGPIEATLADIWRQVLGRERISVERNFFDLGGSSVHLIEIASKANLMLAQDLSVVSYFEHPTVRAMAAHINERSYRAAAAPELQKRSKSRLSARLAQRGTR